MFAELLKTLRSKTILSHHDKPELKNALDFVREEGVFVVTKRHRLVRSVVDLSNIIQILEEKKVDLVVLDQGIDTTNIYGKLQFNILASIGEFERVLSPHLTPSI